MDKMTPIERSSAMAKGLPVDRLPCNPNVANGVARVFGCKISEFNSDAKVLADAQIASYRRFGYDGVRVFTDLFAWAEAMGATITHPEDDTSDLDSPAVDSLDMIDRLNPADPYRDGRLPLYLEAMDRLVNEVGGEIGCAAGLVGPFSNSFFLYGVNNVLRLVKKNPDVVKRLCDVSLETCIAYADASIKKGLSPTISEPLSSNTVVSAKVFREFSLPWLKKLVDFIKSKGKSPIIHICGETKDIWQDIADLEVGGFSVDNVVNLKNCCEAIGDKVKILGHVDPASVMFSGSVNLVRRKTLECILDAWDSPKGYVVMSGCSLPVETPLENIDSMMNAVRDVGYPVDPERVRKLLDATPED